MLDAMKNAALLLALLLAFSIPAMIVASGAASDVRDQSAPVDAEETPNRLSLEGDVRAEYTDTGPDLAAVLSSTDDALRMDQDMYLLEEDLERTSGSEQREALDRAHDRLSERLEALEERERHAVRSHAAGNSSDAELVQALFANYAEAEQLSSAFHEFERQANTVPGYAVSTRAERNQLDLYRGPIAERIDRDVRANTVTDDGNTLLLETSETGYRISMIEGSTTLSDTTRFDNRNLTRESQFDGDAAAAYNHAEELYPWVMAQRSGNSVVGFTETELYHVFAPHSQGQLRVFLDGGTGAVYQESQELTLAALPSEPTNETWTDEGLELSLNETPANGPLEVAVTDAGTGEPVDAIVSVDGYELGETGPGGTMWILPPGESYEITAETETGAVDATIDAE